MKRAAMIVGLCLGVALSSGTALAVSVTMVAESGFAIEGRDLAVMIDGLLEFGATDERQAMMRAAEAPYDVDILLFTHSHFDHFEVSIAAANMLANPDAILVGPRDVVDAVQEESSELDGSRFHVVHPGGIEPEILELPGVELSAYSFPHGPTRQPENVGYLFEVDSLVFFHTGDLDLDTATVLFGRYGLDEAGIDVAFLNLYMIWDPASHASVRALNARCVALFHGTPRALASACASGSGGFENLICLEGDLVPLEIRPGSNCPASDSLED